MHSDIVYIIHCRPQKIWIKKQLVQTNIYAINLQHSTFSLQLNVQRWKFSLWPANPDIWRFFYNFITSFHAHALQMLCTLYIVDLKRFK